MSEATLEAPYSLDDITIEDHDIVVEQSDLLYPKQFPETYKKLTGALELKKSKWVLPLPKLYCISAGESGDIDKLTIQSTKNSINYQNLVREISSKTGLEPKFVVQMLSEPWEYEHKYSIFSQKREEITDILSQMQASDRDQAEVTICLKHRSIPEWTSIDTQRLSAPLLNKIREYLIFESRGWKKLEETLTEEDRAFLESHKSQPQLQLESENPTRTLNPSESPSLNLRGESGNTVTVRTS